MKSLNAAFPERGATTAELALTIFPMMMFIVGLVQFSILALNINSLQYSLNKAARLGSTVADPAVRTAQIEQNVLTFAQQFSVDISDVTVRICPVAQPDCTTNKAGGSGQFFIVSATKSPRFIFGMGSLAMTARVLMKNEPF